MEDTLEFQLMEAFDAKFPESDLALLLEEALSCYYLVPYNALWRAIEVALLACLKMPSPVVDLGGGDGTILHLVKAAKGRRGVHLNDFHTFDLEARRVRRARMLLDEDQAFASAVVADAQSAPYRSGFAQTIVSNCVIEHIPDSAAVLKEVRRLLKPGGRFIFTVPSHNFGRYFNIPSLLGSLGAETLVEQYVTAQNRAFAHFHCYYPDRWAQLLEALGFGVVYWRYYMFPASQKLFGALAFLRCIGWKRYRLGGALHWAMRFLSRKKVDIMRKALTPLWRALLLQRVVAEVNGQEADEAGAALLIVAQNQGAPSSAR